MGGPAARDGADVVDGLPGAHRRRNALERRDQRPGLSPRPPDLQRNRAGSRNRRRRAGRVLRCRQIRSLLCRPRRPRPVRRHHSRPHPTPPRPPHGEVDKGGLQPVRRLLARRRMARDPVRSGRLRLRRGLRVRQQRGPGRRLALGPALPLLALRTGPHPGRVRPGPLLPRGRTPLQPRRTRHHRPASGGDAAAAAVHPGTRVPGRGDVRGLPLTCETGGGGGTRERLLGGAPPLAKHLGRLIRHRRFRSQRLQANLKGRHRWAHAGLPAAPEQVGPADVRSVPGGRGILPGGAAAVHPGVPGGAGGGGAGGAEPRDRGVLPIQRIRLQALPPPLPVRGRLGRPLRPPLAPLCRPQGPLRPPSHPRPRPEALLSLSPAVTSTTLI